METAPLTLAHTHARNALIETRKSNPVAASEEHDLAAGEFATAAQSNADPEALRTLHLLEQHHKKLAEILRFQHEHPSAAVGDSVSVASHPPANLPGTGEAGSAKITADAHQHPPRLPGHNLPLPRETSSIASNLASARGIPANPPRRSSPVSPTLSAHHAGARMTESPKGRTGDARLRDAQSQAARERSGRVPAPKQPWAPPSISPTDITSHQVVPADAAETGQPKSRLLSTEEPFQRFYSTFEGLISKLSAPLAFAGLPLGSDTSGHTDSARQKSLAETKVDRANATRDRPVSEPDVNRLFSRAALRAIRDTNGGTPGSAAESFYVVPTTGGTVSYAGILSRAEKEARRNSMDEEEDFVDARETPSSPEMVQNLGGSRNKGKASRSTDASGIRNTKTLEELRMENEALKQLSDTLSKRLHMWEVNAQTSSLALQQSLKAMHQHNPAGQTISLPSPVPSTVPHQQRPAGDESDQRLKELEDKVRRAEKDLEKVGRENEKLKSVLGRYRERWEKLKEGAKTRRNAEASGATSSTGAKRNGDGDSTVGDSVPPTPRTESAPPAGGE
ncbi:hypothetical protein DTO027B5_744 [Paecilomyces variotii]|nr:hypothetical protein DTO169C6_471 [Paecilomyces variotii]KAJ9290053.1 hypothetical protein DTO021C3_2411 [Paecilomyces variotii]KAJ9329557.1 hypothetical protein DTO027B3_44 [Paecilomyces variotii]KAJ9337395.1 hypothetical protein DTO027B5_744 [Paecilomyces variotii]